MRKRPFRPTTASVILLVIALVGCEYQPTEVEDYQPAPILCAFLYSGKPVGEVYLERVAPLYGYYQSRDYGISGAEILLIQLDGPNAGDTLHFVESASTDSTGIYLPTTADTAKSLVHYRIEAHKPSENLSLWAETIVPDTFSLEITPQPLYGDTLDTLTREDPNILLNWSASQPIGGYILNVTCLDDSFIPLDPDYDPDEDEIPDDSSRWSFDVIFDEFTSTEVPWILFNYQGWHRIELQAVDEAYFTYFFSVFRTELGMMSSLEYNVQGGLGIFASLTRKSYLVYIEKVE